MLDTFKSGRALRLVLAAAALTLSGCAGVLGNPDTEITLSGAQEVPPVSTEAHGSGLIRVGSDHAVSGRVTTIGMAGTAAHIHVGEKGVNGPVQIGLVRIGENIWMVPNGAVLNDDQYRAFLQGGLYVNVHSAAHKGGEIRGQLLPLKNNW